MDGEPNHKNKTAFSDFSGVLWTLPKPDLNFFTISVGLPLKNHPRDDSTQRSLCWRHFIIVNVVY